MAEKIIVGFELLMMATSLFFITKHNKATEEWRNSHRKLLSLVLILQIVSVLLVAIYFIFVIVMLFLTAEY